MPQNNQATVQQKKIDFCEKVSTLFRKYKRIMVVTNKNVTATQMLHIRKDMNGKGEILFGKNSLMRRALESVKADVPEIRYLEEYLYIHFTTSHLFFQNLFRNNMFSFF